MATKRTLIGNIKGPKGDTGAQGPQGATGPGATIEVGTVSTTAYGNTAQVTNSGTATAAVLDFVIPQGKPGEQTTKMSGLTLDTVTASTADYPIPATGDTGSIAWGKVIKFFNDAKTAIASKINISDIVNNLTSTATNKPLSAAQGKALNDALGTTNNNLNTLSNKFNAGGEHFQFLYFADTGWDMLFSQSPVNTTAIVRLSMTTPHTYPFSSNNYIALQWRNGSGAYGTQFVFGYGGTPAYRTCANNVWSAWQNL